MSLKQYHFDQNLVLGANISIEDCIDIFKTIAMNTSDFEYLEYFAKHLDLVAHIPVRKVSSKFSSATFVCNILIFSVF